MKLVLARVFPARLAMQLPLSEGRAVGELLARGDTVLMLATDGDKLQGYACFGLDADGMLTVYAARAMAGLSVKLAMQALFGAAQVIGAPVRVHTEKVKAMAKMMGAKLAFDGIDGDGLPMGVFYG